MSRLTIHLPHRQAESLKDLSADTGESVESLLAEAVDELVRARRAKIDRESERKVFDSWRRGD